jgi:hypothetical protein
MADVLERLGCTVSFAAIRLAAGSPRSTAAFAPKRDPSPNIF